MTAHPDFTLPAIAPEQAEAMVAAARSTLRAMREQITTNGAPDAARALRAMREQITTNGAPDAARALRAMREQITTNGAPVPGFRPGGFIAARVPHPSDTVRHRVRVVADRRAAVILAPAGDPRALTPAARVRVGGWRVVLEVSLWACTVRGYEWTPWRTSSVLAYRDEWADAIAYAVSPAAQAKVGR